MPWIASLLPGRIGVQLDSSDRCVGGKHGELYHLCVSRFIMSGIVKQISELGFAVPLLIQRIQRQRVRI